MVNKELIELCRTVIGAIQESDSLSAAQLRRLLLHIVPQLLAEIDILANAVDSLLDLEKHQPQPAEQKAPAAKPETKRNRKRRRRRR